MHVLLVYPRFPKTFWSFNRALELVGKQVLMPPLGLITVAALLPKEWSLKLVDTNIRAVSSEEWSWADLVIFSAMLVQKRDLADKIQLAKDRGLSVAVGGPSPSSMNRGPIWRGSMPIARNWEYPAGNRKEKSQICSRHWLSSTPLQLKESLRSSGAKGCFGKAVGCFGGS